LSNRRVVVTGLGAITPLGNTVADTWKNLLAGVSGAAMVDSFDTEGYSTRFSASVKGFDVADYMSAKDARKMDTFIHFGIAAGLQALDDAGLSGDNYNPERIGVAIGSGIGGLPNIETQHANLLKSGPRKISPFFVPSTIINMIAGNLSIMRGLQGPNICITTACTTGTHNIGEAVRLIKYGDADAMVCGGAEMATCPLGLAGFGAARALSTRNDDPQAASRPWDKDRDGFVLGDGAGVLVLEEYEMAKARGANIYCELSGYGMSGDAFHMTQPAENGDGARRCMQSAVSDAGLNPQDISYINAHGTSTLVGDVAETNAIKTLFGDHAKQLAVSSTKSMTGHLLGAAGGIEAVFSVKALQEQSVPPTINLHDPDPACDLDYVPHEARAIPVKHALSNSFGFGGTNATLIFSQL
jgi:3-oxoacyl-[acyl-carrier-protein] synthase II